MEGLEIVNFQPSKYVVGPFAQPRSHYSQSRRVLAHPRVQAWQASWAPPLKKELSVEDEMDMEDAIASYYAD